MKVLLTTLLLCYLSVAAAQSTKSLTVYFDVDSYELDSRARQQLDSITDDLRRLPRQSITLSGYCDSRGTDAYNDLLSDQRVTRVKNYLIAHHVNVQTIISATGYGEKNAVNTNETEEQRSLNRRVEISYPAPAPLANNSIPEKTGQVTATETQPVPTLEEALADSTTVSGTNITLKNIHFYGGRHRFLPESMTALQELLNAMHTYPKLVIEIQGHICCQPFEQDGMDMETNQYNLSEARAKEIHDYLLSNGVAPERVSYKGFGHSQPIYPYPEQTEGQRIANRRVEIKIIQK